MKSNGTAVANKLFKFYSTNDMVFLKIIPPELHAFFYLFCHSSMQSGLLLELAYYDVTAHHVTHYATETPCVSINAPM